MLVQFGESKFVKVQICLRFRLGAFPTMGIGHFTFQANCVHSNVVQIPKVQQVQCGQWKFCKVLQSLKARHVYNCRDDMLCLRGGNHWFGFFPVIGFSLEPRGRLDAGGGLVVLVHRS